MLPFEKTNDPDAIENIVCNPIKHSETKEMDDDSTIILMYLIKTKPGSRLPKEDKFFLFSVIEHRVKSVFKFEFEDDRPIMFLSTCETPGKAIMLLWRIQQWSKESGKKIISLEDLCKDIFPFGFPKDDLFKNIWNPQKIFCPDHSLFSDNLVDFTAAGHSLFPKE